MQVLSRPGWSLICTEAGEAGMAKCLWRDVSNVHGKRPSRDMFNAYGKKPQRDVSMARGHEGTCLWQEATEVRVTVYGKRPGEVATSPGLSGKLLTGTARLATGSYELPGDYLTCRHTDIS